jgi:hypothetical protein
MATLEVGSIKIGEAEVAIEECPTGTTEVPKMGMVLIIVLGVEGEGEDAEVEGQEAVVVAGMGNETETGVEQEAGKMITNPITGRLGQIGEDDQDGRRTNDRRGERHETTDTRGLMNGATGVAVHLPAGVAVRRRVECLYPPRR